MDVKYITPFVRAIQRVFETMVHTKVRVGTPMLRSQANFTHDISAVIGFSGDAAGYVVLGFPTDVSCRIATAFAGETIDQNHPDFADAIGELANMVAGSAKQGIAGMNISISLPSVVAGRSHTVLHSKQTPSIVIPCETDLGAVFIEIGMTLNCNKTSAQSKTAEAMA